MSMLSEDDVNLRDLSAEELDAAWDLWFDLAQTTHDSDPPYSHGVLVNTVARDPPAAQAADLRDACVAPARGPVGPRGPAIN